MSIFGNKLETDTYSSPGWNHIYNKNMDVLDGELLKLKALQDVDLDSITDQKPFIWNAVTSKWEPVL
ncbi:MAG: hypothetical protein PF503_06195 [Desulfobacula sp.]|jgi:hypothetical protein|nr:hypothetical protein [Desulfobacula sp.]